MVVSRLVVREHDGFMNRAISKSFVCFGPNQEKCISEFRVKRRKIFKYVSKCEQSAD